MAGLIPFQYLCPFDRSACANAHVAKLCFPMPISWCLLCDLCLGSQVESCPRPCHNGRSLRTCRRSTSAFFCIFYNASATNLFFICFIQQLKGVFLFLHKMCWIVYLADFSQKIVQSFNSYNYFL